MGKGKKVTCGTCLRIMRSDHLKRHMKQHDKEKFENESFCGSSIGTSRTSLQESESDFSSISTYTSTPINEEFAIKSMMMTADEYNNKLALGKIVAKTIKEKKIPQDSLSIEYKDALDLYWNKKQLMDIENVILKTWQESLLQYLKPSNREIIWVQGAKCNEGKSWFQEYIEAKFGWERVMCGLDIKMKKESIYHLIRRRPYMTTDVFTFNIGKADTYEDVNYQVLEQLKDGRILAAKFSSKEIKICTPNIVIVFSNDKPKLAKLAMDRWKIFKIKGNDLVDVSPK